MQYTKQNKTEETKTVTQNKTEKKKERKKRRGGNEQILHEGKTSVNLRFVYRWYTV